MKILLFTIAPSSCSKPEFLFFKEDILKNVGRGRQLIVAKPYYRKPGHYLLKRKP